MEVLRVYVNVTGFYKVVSGEKTVQMLPFEGTCDGPFFRGTILPGGTDTQKISERAMSTLSARYMLEGADCSGNPCRVFIENNANLGEEGGFTTPSIITDSPALKWMETAKLRGRIETIDGQLTIIIDMPGAKEDAVGV